MPLPRSKISVSHILKGLRTLVCGGKNGSVSKVLAMLKGGHNSDPCTHIINQTWWYTPVNLTVGLGQSCTVYAR